MRQRFAVIFLSSYCFLASGPLHGQTKTSAAAADPLGRQTPQGAVIGFLESCHARDYDRASAYLDLRHLSASRRHAEGENLARQLEDVLDRDERFDLNHMSRSQEGDLSDGLGPNLERVASFTINGRQLDLQLERVELQPGVPVWLFSSSSMAVLPAIHKIEGESSFEKNLPEPLVNWQFVATPLWRWIALVLLAVVLAIVSSIVSKAILALVHLLAKPVSRFVGLGQLNLLIGPVRWLISVIAFRAGMVFIGPSALLRLYLSRCLALIFFLALAWLVARILDLIARRLQVAMNTKLRAVSTSVLPLGNRVLKVIVFLIAITAVLGAWGYNTTTILAGLGVGGIAIALAAQKTLENFFGGVSVISDRPVLVGDYCSFGDRSGTVEDIGLRSTRIRTPDRTLVTVPNGQFSTMAIENFAKRDKVWFHPKLNLRRDTTPEQIRQVLKSLTELLTSNPKIEPGQIPARFVGIGTYSLDIDTNVYVLTSNYDEFLQIQQKLLLEILDAVQAAGTALAVPTQASILTYPGGGEPGTGSSIPSRGVS